jgi:hypothetical protein
VRYVEARRELAVIINGGKLSRGGTIPVLGLRVRADVGVKGRRSGDKVSTKDGIS